LIRQLKAHCFLAFQSIRLAQRRHVEPLELGGVLAYQRATFVDQAIDEKSFCPVKNRLKTIHHRGVLGHENKSLKHPTPTLP
jgi:hypothetical protein